MENNLTGINRCGWSGSDAMHQYHDTEWGVPLYDETRLFEFFALDMMQAGLSWSIILRKRQNFRTAFDGFDIPVVANYGEAKIQSLLQDTGIVRNKAKIHAIIHNAQLLLDLRNTESGFSNYLWSFVNHTPVINRWKTLTEVPAKTELSDRISKDMVQRGYKFCGSTIIYAFIQSAGLVNDHLIACFRHEQVGMEERK